MLGRTPEEEVAFKEWWEEFEEEHSEVGGKFNLGL